MKLSRVFCMERLPLLLCFTAFSALAGSGGELSITDKHLNVGIFGDTTFEGESRDDLSMSEDELSASDFGSVLLRANLLIADEADSVVVNGTAEVGRKIPLGESYWLIGLGVRPAFASIKLKRDNKNHTLLAIQLGGSAQYRIRIDGTVEWYAQSRLYHAPDIITVGNRFSSLSFFSAQTGIYVVGNTAIFVEFIRESASGKDGSDNGPVVEALFLGLRLGL